MRPQFTPRTTARPAHVPAPQHAQCGGQQERIRGRQRSLWWPSLFPSSASALGRPRRRETARRAPKAMTVPRTSSPRNAHSAQPVNALPPQPRVKWAASPLCFSLPVHQTPEAARARGLRLVSGHFYGSWRQVQEPLRASPVTCKTEWVVGCECGSGRGPVTGDRAGVGDAARDEDSDVRGLLRGVARPLPT